MGNRPLLWEAGSGPAQPSTLLAAEAASALGLTYPVAQWGAPGPHFWEQCGRGGGSLRSYCVRGLRPAAA